MGQGTERSEEQGQTTRLLGTNAASAERFDGCSVGRETVVCWVDRLQKAVERAVREGILLARDEGGEYSSGHLRKAAVDQKVTTGGSQTLLSINSSARTRSPSGYTNLSLQREKNVFPNRPLPVVRFFVFLPGLTVYSLAPLTFLAVSDLSTKRKMRRWLGLGLCSLLLSPTSAQMQVAPKRVSCVAGLVAVQREAYAVESNGCSKPGFLKIDGEEDFTYCCDRHDASYQVCGLERTTADSSFKSCLNDMCTRNFKANTKCPAAANAYSAGVGLFGQTSWLTSQESACQCVPSADVRTHYERLFSEFYSRYAPERREEVMQSAPVRAALVSSS
jgi:hypothetical protein